MLLHKLYVAKNTIQKCSILHKILQKILNIFSCLLYGYIKFHPYFYFYVQKARVKNIGNINDVGCILVFEFVFHNSKNIHEFFFTQKEIYFLFRV